MMATATLVRDHAVADSDPAILGAVLMPGITLAAWERSLPSALRQWLNVLDIDHVDDLDFTCPAEGAGSVVAAAFVEAGYGPGEEAQLMAGDVAMLLRRYAALLDLVEVAVRLEVIETDACRKFHADLVTARAICTYRGPGTEWLDTDDGLRVRDGAARAGAVIRRLGAGDVALMKGRRWSDAPLMHRSPPIAGTGNWRLTLVLNPPQPDD